MNLRTHISQPLLDKFVPLLDAGCKKFDFLGGRRSGKTYFILQYLLGQMAQGAVISVATMTDTQGRLGAFQDAKDIILGSDLRPYCDVTSNPKMVRCGEGRMFFQSYMISERAKGIACDWLYMNEGNNFSEQQYIDLSASVREGVFVDRNPNSECWTERNPFSMIHSTWEDNRENLTEAQIQWFLDLKAKAESPNATAADIAFYRMYYLGEYADIQGSIFTPANTLHEMVIAAGMDMYFIYGDPSALCGADYFALVLCGIKNGYMYIIDTWSKNVGCRADVAEQIDEWCKRYDVRNVFIEGNGLASKNFIEEQRASLHNLKPYTNTDNKHGRILGNYEGICTKVIFNDSDNVNGYMKQIYEYIGKNSEKYHDDNIDAVNSAYEIAHRYYKAI